MAQFLYTVSGITSAPPEFAAKLRSPCSAVLCCPQEFAAKLGSQCSAPPAAWSYPMNLVVCPQVKAYLADPSAFASSAPEAAAGGDSAPAEEKKEEAKAEEEEESDEDMGFSLFD